LPLVVSEQTSSDLKRLGEAENDNVAGIEQSLSQQHYRLFFLLLFMVTRRNSWRPYGNQALAPVYAYVASKTSL
jgi:hypothetical protein